MRCGLEKNRCTKTCVYNLILRHKHAISLVRSENEIHVTEAKRNGDNEDDYIRIGYDPFETMC